jgi:release factor glutamine methyltransferase
MTQSDPWTIGRMLEWTTDHLRKQGADSPRLDAEVLLASARGCPRIELYAAYGEVPSGETRAAYRDLVRRRAEGTPVAYLVGHREFYSQDFRVTPDVLIPRPETEFLMMRLLDLARQSAENEPEIVDVGTGSGILAVCAACHLPRARVTAIDISLPALRVAQENALRHQVAERVRCLESDLLGAVGPDEKFHLVVSNPPYVSVGEWRLLAREVREQEPRLALVGGRQGTEIIERLVPQAARHLYPGGWLVMEISPMIEARVHALLQAEGAFGRVAVTRDLARLPRVVEAQRL